MVTWMKRLRAVRSAKNLTFKNVTWDLFKMREEMRPQSVIVSKPVSCCQKFEDVFSSYTFDSVVKLPWTEVCGGAIHWPKLQCYTKIIHSDENYARPYTDDLLRTGMSDSDYSSLFGGTGTPIWGVGTPTRGDWTVSWPVPAESNHWCDYKPTLICVCAFTVRSYSCWRPVRSRLRSTVNGITGIL